MRVDELKGRVRNPPLLLCALRLILSSSSAAVKPSAFRYLTPSLSSFVKPRVLVQLFEFFLAGVVVHFMRKVRRENKRLVADDADGEGQRQLVAFDTDVRCGLRRRGA